MHFFTRKDTNRISVPFIIIYIGNMWNSDEEEPLANVKAYPGPKDQQGTQNHDGSAVGDLEGAIMGDNNVASPIRSKPKKKKKKKKKTEKNKSKPKSNKTIPKHETVLKNDNVTVYKGKTEEHQPLVKNETYEETRHKEQRKQDGIQTIISNESQQNNKVMNTNKQQPPDQSANNWIDDGDYDINHDDENEGLSENVYSLIFTTPCGSQAFMFAMSVIAVQKLILWILLFDLIQVDALNPFQIPPGVPIVVTFAQGLAMLLVVAIQDDLIVAITKLVAGLPTIEFANDMSEYSLKFSSLSKSTWFLSGILQFLSGFVLLIDIFLLTMQAESVKDVCVNFAALMFIAEIDDIAFKLALYGFVNNHIISECKFVKKCIIHKSIEEKKKENTFHRVLLLIHFILLFAGFGYLVNQQLSGKFVCQTLFMQFGDSIDPLAAFDSGLYYQQDKRISDRSHYIDEKGTFQLAYCQRNKIWTLSEYFVGYEYDVCDDYVIKSEETKTYDVTSLDTSTWMVRNWFDNHFYNVSEQFLPVDWIRLTCNECNNDACSGTCTPKQVSVTRDVRTGDILSEGTFSKFCQCEDKQYGINCEYAAPCETLVWDERTEPFRTFHVGNTTTTSYTRFYESYKPTFFLSNITYKHRPVYYSNKHTNRDYIFIILFSGRRWILTDFQGFFDSTFQNVCLDYYYEGDINLLLECSKPYFEEIFHPYLSYYTVEYISEPMDYLTSTDRVSPHGLKWFLATSRDNGGNTTLVFPLDNDAGPSLLCAECNLITNNCKNWGECGVETPHTCRCEDGFSGSLCEHTVQCSDLNGTCQNGGNCNYDKEVCECPEGFNGHLCQFA